MHVKDSEAGQRAHRDQMPVLGVPELGDPRGECERVAQPRCPGRACVTGYLRGTPRNYRGRGSASRC